MAGSNIPIGVGSLVGGRYRLDRLIGQGAGGSVWQASHETIGRTVAIKFLTRTQARASIRFLQEARLAAQVQNRFVVSIFDFGNLPDGTLYMVMERLRGETLGARLSRAPAIHARELLRLVRQALLGLQAVHARGIVHRDLKPENIFLVEEAGEIYPKLLDFGVSRASDPAVLGPAMAKLTATGMTVGTPLYMAPEQARGRREIDARADIYSMGVILFRALCGRAPYRESNVLDLMMAVVNSTEAPALFERRAELGRPISDVVQRAMAPDRHRRYPDAATFARALEEVEASVPESAQCPIKERYAIEGKPESEPSSASTEAGDVEPTAPVAVIEREEQKKKHRLWIGGAFAAATVAGLALLFSVRGSSPTLPKRPAQEPAPTVGAASLEDSVGSVQPSAPLVPDVGNGDEVAVINGSRSETAGGPAVLARAVAASKQLGTKRLGTSRSKGAQKFARPEPSPASSRDAPAVFTQPDF